MNIAFRFPEATDAYMDDFVPLAEGLRDLGVKFYSDRNYWQHHVGGPFLFKESSQEHLDVCHVDVFSYRAFRHFDMDDRPVMGATDWLRRLRSSAFKVLIDNEDGYETSSFHEQHRFFDLILRSKYNRRCFHPSNHLPWALGYSDRLSSVQPQDFAAFKDRRREILVNFGASHSYEHGTRSLYTPTFIEAVKNYLVINQSKDDLSSLPTDPWDQLMWRQTQRRHCRSYYERLAHSQAVAAFCGELIPPAPFRPAYLVGGKKALLKRTIFGLLGRFDYRPLRSIQWDSWRFWEGLTSGCLVFNIDLDHYGVQLPVMPENGKHYVGLRLDRIREGVKEVLEDQERMESIARSGNMWVRHNYSPIAVAQRFLDIVRSEAINRGFRFS